MWKISTLDAHHKFTFTLVSEIKPVTAAYRSTVHELYRTLKLITLLHFGKLRSTFTHCNLYFSTLCGISVHFQMRLSAAITLNYYIIAMPVYERCCSERAGSAIEWKWWITPGVQSISCSMDPSVELAQSLHSKDSACRRRFDFTAVFFLPTSRLWIGY